MVDLNPNQVGRNEEAPHDKLLAYHEVLPFYVILKGGNAKMNREKIEALIDELTPCLIHRETGERGQKIGKPILRGG